MTLPRKNMKKSKFKKAIKGIAWAVGISVGVAAGGFYVFIVSGWVKGTQELWVTTAMTTFTHHWLAESFIKQEVIEDIMERTRIDDSGYETNTELLVNVQCATGGTSLDESLMGDRYINKGYELLEEGIYIKDVSGTGWKGKLVLVKDPSRVDLVQTRYQWTRGDLIKTLVPLHNARLGVNAGGFNDGANYDSNGGIPAGLLIINSEVINSSGSAQHSVIGLNKDNVLVLGKMTKQEAVDADLRAAVDFRPFLIVNGETTIKGDNPGGWGVAPRTSIGQLPTKEILFLVIDGRQTHSIGVDLRVVQDVLFEEGCINAALLDGGSSSILYHVEQGYLNKPSLGHERYINNAWIVK